MKYQESYSYGKGKEEEFHNICGRLNISTKSSTKDQDIYDHIDGYITLWGKRYSYDFKAQKKKNRGDENYSEELWIELKNVRGNPGWLYGKADLIIFETKKEYIVTSREKLPKIVEKLVDRSEIFGYPCLYKLYRRKGREDLITLIREEDLEGCVKFKIGRI